MKRRITVALVAISTLLVVYVAFTSSNACVIATSYRVQWITQLNLCPPHVAITVEELSTQFNSKVKPGDKIEVIEATLTELGVGYSWDPYSKRYQGIIRHPDSNFHAVVVHVYVNDQHQYTKLEAHDAFTAL